MIEDAAAALRELVHYDKDTGLFTWKHGQAGGAKVGTSDPDGYRLLRFQGRNHFQHRLAWLWVYGAWPSGQIDHINGEKSDNRLANLRDVSGRINNQNRKSALSRNISGYLGVSFHRWAKTKPWAAGISADGVRYNLGRFDTPEEAHAKYIEAKRVLHEGCTI